MKIDLSVLLKQAAQLGQTSWEQASELVQSGTAYLTETVKGIRIFGSTERLAGSDEQHYDEKHYFLVPFRRAESGYSVYSMRCLPQGVTPINNLPKRRVLHLPSPDAVEVFDDLMRNQARDEVTAEHQPGLGGQLNDLADQIDKLDDKVFHGLLLIGGLVALVNPLAGAVIAAKSLIPSGAMLLSKFGLRAAGDSLDQRKLAAKIRQAERDVLSQFRATNASSLVNPVLSQLELALSTTEFEFEPLFDAKFDTNVFDAGDSDRIVQLSYRAICNVYEQTIRDESVWKSASLGPEDVAWINAMRHAHGDG